MKNTSENGNNTAIAKANFECTECDFISTTNQGLKVHMKRKHTKYAKDKRPSKCEVCDQEFKDYKGNPETDEYVEKHMMAHSYKCSSYLKYKCEECDFWGPNTLTMEVHMKKHHSEKVQCGLCDYEADNIEQLETHLVTCETYKCFDCKIIFKTMREIKDHINKKHAGEPVWLTHSKSDRKYPEYFDSKDYSRKELFKK